MPQGVVPPEQLARVPITLVPAGSAVVRSRAFPAAGRPLIRAEPPAGARGAGSYTYYAELTADDRDGDGLVDGEELSLYLTDPDNTDSDGDGLDDGDEVVGIDLDDAAHALDRQHDAAAHGQGAAHHAAAIGRASCRERG